MDIKRAIGAGMLLLLAGSAAAQDGNNTFQNTTLIMGTATQGGGFPVYGNAFAEVIAEADPTLSIETRNTMGSSENMPMMEKGQLDLGLVAGGIFYQALQGIRTASAQAEDPDRDLWHSRHVCGARRQSLPQHSGSGRQDGCVRCQGLGHSDPGTLHAGRDRIEAKDGDFKSILLDHAGEGPEMVLDGRADAIWGAGIGYPGFFELAKGPSGVRFIAPTAEEIARMSAKYTLLKPMTIPAGSYPGQTAPIQSARLMEFRADAARFAGRRRLSPGAHAAWRGRRVLQEAEAGLRETTAANTVAAVPDIALIHPGVMKYYREIGVVK